MGALPRPDLAPGPHRDLVEALHDLHHRAGWPSLRVLARACGCSPTTVSAVFSSPRLPSWGLLELLVEAMDGDVDRFHAVWLAATAPEPGAVPEPRIAGRKEELAAIRGHLEGGSGLLLVTGEAGMGKTRLMSTAAGLFSDRGFTAAGSCLPLSTDVPLLPVADLLRSIHDLDQGQWLEDALAGCAPYVPGSLRRLLPELDQIAGAQPGPDDDWSRQRLFAAVAVTLTALVATRPLAILIEDLHWADSATLDLLEHLLARGVGLPILGTWRLEDPATPTTTREWCARVQRLPTAVTLALGPLSRDETAEQLALLAPSGATSPDLIDRIHHRSAGQPLFTEQLAAHADDDQPLPQLLADLLDRRIEGLAPPAWAIARALGVADRSLTDTLIADVTGLQAADLTSGLHELDDHRLLRAATGHDVELRHPLLAEAVRRRLVAPETVDEHRRIATALAGSPDASPAEVAEHWERAEDPEHEIIWRIRAARAAGQRFALAQEAEQWRRALRLWPDGIQTAGSPPVRKQDAYLAAMDVLESIDVAAALDLSREAVTTFAHSADRDVAALCQRVGYLQGIVGDPGSSVLLEKAIRMYARMPESSAYVDALERQEAQLRMLGRHDEAAAAMTRAIEISARLGYTPLQRGMVARLAWHTAVAGDVDLALREIETALRIEVPWPDPQGDVHLAAWHTELLLMGGADAAEVEAAGRLGLDAAATWGLDTFLVAKVRAHVSRALTRAGQVQRAAELVDPVTETALVRDQWPVHMERAGLDVLRGRAETASERLEALWALDVPWMSQRVELAEHAAIADLWRGRPRAALDRLVGELRVALSTDVGVLVGGALVLTARAASDLVDCSSAAPDLRRELLTRLRGLRGQSRSDPIEHPGFAARSALAAAWAAETARLVGTPSVERWVAAAREWDRITRPHDAAYCRWRAAQVALATGQGSTAHTLLRRAEHDAREHVPLLAAIRRAEADRGLSS